MVKQNRNLTNTQYMVRIALCAALSTILYFIELPMIPGFEHLKIDLSDIPAAFAAFTMGPFAGIMVELLKNLLHLFRSTTSGIGDLMNFLIGSVLIISAYYAFQLFMRKTKNPFLGLTASMITSIVLASLFGIAVNAIFYPLFLFIRGLQIESTAVFITYLVSTIPLNVLKSVITLAPLYTILKNTKFAVIRP